MWFDPMTITKTQDAPPANLANLLITGAERGVTLLEISKLAELADREDEKTHFVLTPMTPKEESELRAWLVTINETDPENITKVLNQYQTDASARKYYVRRMAGNE
jgi:hypothetical protein